MFTGLVEALGTITSFTNLDQQARLGIAMPFARELALGDSVAINGCCLTVAAFGENEVFFDLLSQTLEVTALGELKQGDTVNLERAMAVGARFGGHFVQGHIDGVGELVALDPRGQDHRLVIRLSPEVAGYCIDKGSLCIDGISLTIAELGGLEATFWITPHTFSHTHLQSARPGQKINLEADLLAKYVKKLLPAS